MQGNVGEVVETTGVPVGDSRATISLTRTSTGRYKAVFKLEVPVVQNQTVNGVVSPVVVRKAYAEATFSFDAASTESERNDIVGMFSSAMAANKPLFHDTVVKLQGVY
jgi:negative regulator of sigma E activity